MTLQRARLQCEKRKGWLVDQHLRAPPPCLHRLHDKIWPQQKRSQGPSQQPPHVAPARRGGAWQSKGTVNGDGQSPTYQLSTLRDMSPYPKLITSDCPSDCSTASLVFPK